MMRGELLVCGHESYLPKELLHGHNPQAYCMRCRGWSDRFFVNLGVLADCAERNAEALSQSASGSLADGNGGYEGAPASVTVHINGPAFGANAQYHAATAEAVVNQLVKLQKRQGPKPTDNEPKDGQ